MLSLNRTLWLLVAAACIACLPVEAQRESTHDYSVVSQVRIDLRDLGYPPVDVIPSGESAIRALAVAPDGRIYGATSGERAHLFVLEPQHGYVVPLGFLPGKQVHHSLVVAANGDVYIGADGQLLRYVSKGGGSNIRIGSPCPVQDLGTAVKGQQIYATTIDPKLSVIYGVTSPDGDFFSYDIQSGALRSHGRVATTRIPGEKFENEKNIGRALVVDREGDVYTTGEGGKFFRLRRGELEELKVAAPTVPGREVYNRVDAWAQDPAGSLYGGTSDGYLFQFDPKTMRVRNLGKPLAQYRIRGLVCARSKLYGIGGDDDDMARLFSYDPVDATFEVLGMIDVNRRSYYSWKGYVFDSMVAGLDGTVYMGQAERKSKLYLFYPN